MEFKIFGKYTIIEKIASGGMAEILLAADLGTAGVSRFVAVKRALDRFSDKEEFKDMFRTEGRIACNLNHGNITPIYEFGIENNKFFLAMEYISGRNLRQVLKKIEYLKKSLAIPHAIHIIKETAAGLNYAHNAIDSNIGNHLHLIHRDVSPQNILINFDGEIKLIDFGIAKLADTNSTQDGHLKGKFGYMSPEQASGGVLDCKTDIFSLGIILWELLANKRLFAFKNEMTTLKKVKSCEIPDLKKINPKIPDELLHIVNKALSKNRNLRYASMAQMEKDLTVFLNTNYPRFSQYDLGTLMKSYHEKEILKEREQLNRYSKELKVWRKRKEEKIQFSNSHETLEDNLLLNMPDIDEENTMTIDITNEVPAEELAQKTQSSFTESLTESLTESKLKESTATLNDIEDSVSNATARINSDDSGLIMDVINTEQPFLEELSYTKTKNSTFTHSNKINLPRKINKKSMTVVISSVVLSCVLLFGGIFTLMNLEKIAKSPLLNYISSHIQQMKKTQPVKTFQTNIFKEVRSPAQISKKIFIETKPSGAQFIFNKRRYITPIALNIPASSPFSIVIKKSGYRGKRVTFKSGKSASSYLKITLKRIYPNTSNSITIIR